MALTATFQTLHDGMRNAVVQVNLTADSVGDINPTIAVDVSAMTPPAKSVKVKLDILCLILYKQTGGSRTARSGEIRCFRWKSAPRQWLGATKNNS